MSNLNARGSAQQALETQAASRASASAGASRIGWAALGVAFAAGGLIGAWVAGWGWPTYLALAAAAAAFGLRWAVRRADGPALGPAERAEAEEEARQKELRRFVSKAQYLENVGDLGERAAAQVDRLWEKRKRFVELLGSKFDPSEMTYERYFSTADRAYASVMDSLRQATTALNLMAAESPSYLEDRLKAAPNPSPDRDALLERQSLRARQARWVEDALAFNEKAMAEIDRVANALIETNVGDEASRESLAATMADLAELAERAKRYAGTPR